MASLYRPVFNRYIVTVDSDNGPKAKRVSAKEAKDAQGNLLPGLKHARERSKKWYGKYRDHNGDLKKTPLSPVKELARSMLVELVRKAQRRRAGQKTRSSSIGTKTLSVRSAIARARATIGTRESISNARCAAPP